MSTREQCLIKKIIRKHEPNVREQDMVVHISTSIYGIYGNDGIDLLNLIQA